MILDKLNQEILTVKGLKVYFPVKGGVLGKLKGYVKAVDGIDFSIRQGETLGLVGESGCGKSTTARGILRLVEPYEGKIYFNRSNILEYDEGELRRIRRHMQMIFQDPYASLNPRRTVGSIIGEPFAIHEKNPKKERIQKVINIMEEVGLRPDYINRFPHEFSGGQRQRIGIARALALKPQLIICDEPVSALDVSIQAQILNLLQDLQEKYNLTYLFISHDLAVVKHICDRIFVMYLGKIVESASKKQLFANPIHPYTEILLKSIPIPKPNIKKDIVPIAEDIPNPFNPPAGCRFHTRCPYVKEICKKEEPIIKEVEAGHFYSCHLR